MLLSDEKICKLCGKMESGDCDENGTVECNADKISLIAKAQFLAIYEQLQSGSYKSSTGARIIFEKQWAELQAEAERIKKEVKQEIA